MPIKANIFKMLFCNGILCTRFKLTTLGLTMVPCITSCTITSVACSVARHRRYTFSTIQTRIRRCQAAVKKRNVPGTCLLCTNLEKRMNELIYVNRKPISPLGALQKGLVFKINYICITYNE